MYRGPVQQLSPALPHTVLSRQSLLVPDLHMLRKSFNFSKAISSGGQIRVATPASLFLLWILSSNSLGWHVHEHGPSQWDQCPVLPYPLHTITDHEQDSESSLVIGGPFPVSNAQDQNCLATTM